jgi:hypothetical protein
MKLSIKAFAMTCAFVAGVGIFLVTWWMILFAGASGRPTIIQDFYLGYSVTPIGSLVGLAWGFADGLIGGAIFAWLYNLLAK